MCVCVRACVRAFVRECVRAACVMTSTFKTYVFRPNCKIVDSVTKMHRNGHTEYGRQMFR